LTPWRVRGFNLHDSVCPKVRCYWSDLVIEYGSVSLLSLVSSGILASLASDPSQAPLDSAQGTKKAPSSEVETTSTETTWSPPGI